MDQNSERRSRRQGLPACRRYHDIIAANHGTLRPFADAHLRSKAFGKEELELLA